MIAANNSEAPPAAPRHAPVSKPITMRALRPTAAVLAGPLGSCSDTHSTSAASVKLTTAHFQPMNATGAPASLSQPKCAAQATTAGAVSDRRPATTPIPNANASANPGFIEFPSD